MPLSQLMRILWIHRMTHLYMVIAMLVLASAVSLLVPKRYKAEAAVVVDVRGSDPLAPDGAVPVQPPSNYVATQVDVIGSHNVALKVIDRLQLDSDPEFIEKFYDANGADAPLSGLRDWGAEELLKFLNVRPSKDSNVIYLQFTSKNAQKSAATANAFGEAYLQTSLELNIDPARRQAGWFDDQLNGLRGALEQARRKVSAYEVEHGVIGTDDNNKLDTESARLTEISNHLVAAQATMYEAESRQRQLKEALAKDGPDAAVDVLNNPLLQDLKTELARAEARLANAAQRYDRNHPQYLSALAERDSLRSKVASEVEKANSSVAKEARIAHQSTADLERALDEQRRRILGLQHNQDDYSVLKRDAENAQTAYDTALGRGSQTHLESHLDHTNIALLNHAFPPIRQAWPRLFLDCALGVILGLLLGAGVSLASERLDRRIRSQEDLVQGANIAVLSELPRDREPTRSRVWRWIPLLGKTPQVEPA
ncbi:MAG: chain length determinant protein EpsF [Steroidobacteraceae bacterium]